MRYLKKLIFWGCVAGVLYFVLSSHFIIFGKSFAILKKSQLTLNYTFFSTQGKSAEYMLAIDELRNDGIGRLLVEKGLIKEEQLERILERIEEKKQEGS